MKKILSLILCLLCIQLSAKNTITYLKMERTACFGKCPSYSVEFFKNGEVIYTGKNHVKMIGTHKARMSKTQMRNFFRKFEKYKYAGLAARYKVLSTDAPGMNIYVTVNGKSRRIRHAEAGPRFLRQIGVDVDEQVKDLRWTGQNNEVIEEPVVVEEIQPAEHPDVFEFVEQMPEFPGGDAALKNYLLANLRYPAIAKDNNIQGKVFCKFVVDKNGYVNNVNVVKGIGYGCDDEAVRVIQAMPRWKPGRQNGREVNVSYTLPVFFKLN